MNTTRDTFDEARDAIKHHGRHIVEAFFPGGRWDRRGEYWLRSPLRSDDEKPNNFSINQTGLYKDLAHPDHAGDIIDLISRTRGISKAQAAELILGNANNGERDSSAAEKKEKHVPVIPIPQEALATFKNHASSKHIIEKYGDPVKAWQYNDKDGAPWCVVSRHEKAGKKQIIPYQFCEDGKWHAGAPVKRNRSLFNIDRVNREPVLVVEGEKCASVNVPGYTVVTWMGGSAAVNLSDWTPLKNLQVIIWPDADEPGFSAALKIKEKLPNAEILDIQDKPQGWDIADAETDGVDIPSFINSCQRFASKVEAAELIPPSAISFSMSKVEQVKAILSRSLRFRCNIITGKYEFQKIDSDSWREFTDRHFNSIRAVIQEHYIKTLSESDLRMVIESDFTPEYDPIHEYFSALPEWDGEVDYIRKLADLITVKPGQFGTTDDGKEIDAGDVWRLYLMRWMVATTATMLRRYENHTCLTLLGAQGIGKTTFLRRLGISEELVFVGAYNPADKDSKINIAEKVIIVLDELEGTTKHDLAGIKSHMTQNSIDVRRPYGRRSQRLPRRASFSASANDEHVLSDLTGARRWLCIYVKSVDYLGVTPELMRNVYSQALSLLDSGFKYWFDGDEIVSLDKRNASFYAPCPEEEALLKLFDKASFSDTQVDKLTNTEILQCMSNRYPSIKYSQKKLGQILAKLGYERGKHNGVYCYAVRSKSIG